MKIGIIGAGSVGVSLGKALLKAGHTVTFSSREPHSDKMQALLQELGTQAHTDTPEAVINAHEVLVLAVSGANVPEIAQLSGWQGKTVIDLTNRFGGGERTSAEEFAQQTGAHVVKAFNTIGAEHYQNPDFGGQAATMFITGDDVAAKRLTAELASEIGFEVVDVGPLSATKHLDHLAALWVHLVRTGHGRNIAFKLLHK